MLSCFRLFFLLQVPSSYIDLQKLVEADAKRCHEVEKPPVLSQKEFAALAGDTGDITDPEELTLGSNSVHCRYLQCEWFVCVLMGTLQYMLCLDPFLKQVVSCFRYSARCRFLKPSSQCIVSIFICFERQ